MNPPTSQPSGQSSGQTVVVGGTSSSGVQFHTHPASAIVSGELADDRMPDRLGAAAPAAEDADAQLDNGWWAAGTGAANMPASSSWSCRTIRHPDDTFGTLATQIAHEVVSPYRIYQRTASIFWTAWEQVDRTFYDTRYQLVSDIDFQKDIQSADVTPSGTTNSALTGLSISVTSPGTSAVYNVRLKTDVAFVGAQTNIVELLVDGVAEAEGINTGAAATGYRIPGYGDWRITGLAAGSRTFTAQTRNTAAGTNATVKATHTLMTVTRVS